MINPFARYFFSYIFFARTRQRLLFLALVGLFLSSFALIFLQSTMNGLQEGLIRRSKHVSGHAVIDIKNFDEELKKSLTKYLFAEKIDHFWELEQEILLKHGNYLSPVVVHGVSKNKFLPKFLENISLTGVTLGSDLAYKVKSELNARITLISPVAMNSLLGDIPRQATELVEDMVLTDVPEIDMFHAWTRVELLQNLIRARVYNKVRIVSPISLKKLRHNLQQRFGEKIFLTSWEEKNQSLLWAFKLESTVMVFLFVVMTLLVSLTITSSLLIFFRKIRLDLLSFWILGGSKRQLLNSSKLFLIMISFLTSLSGLCFGLIILTVLDLYGIEVMPDFFVERKIPVHITWQGIVVAFSVPFGISMIFSYFSLNAFKKEEQNYITQLRSIGG